MIDLVAKYGGICVFIGIAEILSSIFWWKIYFSFGIPLFKRSIQVKSPEMKLPDADDIEEYALSDNPRHTPILARRFSETAFGFRETLLYFRLFQYVPVMHGYISFNQTRRQIEVRGYVNWYILAITFVFLSFTLSAAVEGGGFVFLAMSIGFLAIIGNGYSIQHKRFSQLADIMQKLLS